jgi:outer membrane receptor for monomeric catechols
MLSEEEVIRDLGSVWRNRFNLPEIEVDLKGKGELAGGQSGGMIFLDRSLLVVEQPTQVLRLGIRQP